MLVESGVEQADGLCLDIYLVAAGTRALELYRKHGFELLDEITQDLWPWGGNGTCVSYILLRRRR
jgi:ribosomal protein S18 acetylase RimI-like enzyme